MKQKSRSMHVQIICALSAIVVGLTIWFIVDGKLNDPTLTPPDASNAEADRSQLNDRLEPNSLKSGLTATPASTNSKAIETRESPIIHTGIAVTVVVKDMKGHLVDGAKVLLQFVKSSTLDTTDADWHVSMSHDTDSYFTNTMGHAEFTATSDGPCWIYASHPDFGVGSMEVASLNVKTGNRRYEITLAYQFSIAGLVITDNGTPIENATVAAKQWIPGSATPLCLPHVRSNEAGEFRLHLPSGFVSLLKLRISGDGYASKETDLNPHELKATPPPFPVVILERSRSVTLKFVNIEDGDDPAGIIFTIGWGGVAGSGPVMIKSRTDHNGAATVDGIPQCEFIRVQIYDPEFALDLNSSAIEMGVRTFGVAIQLPQSSDQDIKVSVIRAGIIEGTLEDIDSGTRLSGVSIESGMLSDLLSRNISRAKTTTTLNDGTFRLSGMQRTNNYVRIISDEWEIDNSNGGTWDRQQGATDVTSGYMTVDLTRDSSPSHRKIMCRKRGIIFGRVVDTNGNGVDGVRLIENLEPRSLEYSLNLRRGKTGASVTESGGKFQLRKFSRTPTTRIVVDDHRYLRTSTPEYCVEPGESINIGDVVVRRGKNITLKALDERGSVNAARFLLYDSPLGRNDATCQRVMLTTDKNGQASSSFVSSNRVTLEFSGAPDNLIPMTDDVVFEVSDDTTIEIKMMHSCTMRAQVVSLSGQPIERVFFLLKYIDDEGSEDSTSIANGLTNRDGIIEWMSGRFRGASIVEVRQIELKKLPPYSSDSGGFSVIDGTMLVSGVLNRVVVKRL